MRIRKGLIIGIFLALVLGTAVAALAAPASPAPTDGPRPLIAQDPPLTVPVGHVGDRLVYARFDTRDGAPTPVGNDIFIVDRLEGTPDKNGKMRQALVVRSDVVDDNGTR